MKDKTILIVAAVILCAAVVGYLVGTRTGTVSIDTTPSEAAAPFSESQQSVAYYQGNQSIMDRIEVLSHLKAKLEESPDNPRLMAQIGDTYFDMRQFEDATVYYKKAIEIDPDDIDNYNDLGLANYYLGNTADAIDNVEDGIKRDPSYQRIWLTKGFLMIYGLGNQDEARSSWEKAVSIDPDSQVGKAAKEYLVDLKSKSTE